MTDNTSYIKELVREKLEILIEDNEIAIVKYLREKGYRVNMPPKEVHDAYTFENAWDLYQKKVGDKRRLNKKWNSMSAKDRKAATLYIPLYVLSTPDKQFRKNFQTYLNQRGWEDELINAEPPATKKDTEISKLIVEARNEIQNIASGKKQDEERNRILGMIDIVACNPRSLAYRSLVNYYNRGYLQELGIKWKP